jgi:hypothetical protein
MAVSQEDAIVIEAWGKIPMVIELVRRAQDGASFFENGSN